MSRPTNAGASNAGYLNAHYINDGKAANVIDDGVPQCGATPPPSQPTYPEGASVFFEPKGHTTLTPAWWNLMYPDWRGGSCIYNKQAVSDPFHGAWISQLSGWSLGRLGPAFFLNSASTTMRSHVHQVLLVDPGNTTDFAGSCESSRYGHFSISATYADWLAMNPNNKLVIISAQATASDNHVGLQNYYLKTIKQRGLNRQVLVCNDDRISHDAAFNKYAMDRAGGYITHFRFNCPSGVYGWTP